MNKPEEVFFKVNGRSVETAVEPRTTLVDCPRYNLRLTGTHVGCEHGVCGACTVLADGAAVRSCRIFAVQADGMEITTVEGLSDGEALSPLQEAFRRHHALPARPEFSRRRTRSLRKSPMPMRTASARFCRAISAAAPVM